MVGKDDFETLLKWTISAVVFIFTLGGVWATHKREVKALRERQDMQQTEIESIKSKLVRPEDIKMLAQSIKESKEEQERAFNRFEAHQKDQLALITKMLDIVISKHAHK